MKRYISYFAVLLAVLLGAACSKDDAAPGTDGRTGFMAMTVSTRQTADTGEYDPLQHQTVYIYNDEGGLLRKYTSKEACPERLELLAGTYRVAVEAGEEAPADFTKRLYKGEETFTVKPGETTNVAVVCQIVNTVVEVKFDDSILQNLAPGYSVWIAGGEKVDEQAAEAGSVPALRFTTEGTGYYTLPAGTTSLAWLFRGTHVEGKNVEMEDYITNVKAGGKYTLTFKYSPDLPGYIDCVLISVDPGTDDKDDEIIFSPDPAVISEGFDIAEIQKYRSGEKKYRIMAFSELTRFTVSVGDESYDALGGTTEGISLEPVDKYNVRLTLSDAFFASCQAGDQEVTFRIEDANGGSSEVATTYRLEGLVPVTADDYDLWANTVTLRVVSFTPGTTVQFGLRSSGGEWQPMAGTPQGDDFITAGLVTVNGQIVTQLGTKVLPTDEVKFNDSRVQGEKKVYLVLNKPKGYVTSLDDPHAGKTVMELVQGACTERIYPVGRLDKNSLGLLLFTNDGDLTKQLTHPAFRKKKIYQVSLDKPLTRADMDRIAEGITLEDGEIFADEISYVKDNKQEVGIEIHSGRNRIVRRIFEFLGYTVTKLDRVYYAGLTKKNLKRGAWRFLSREEVERLKSGQYE